MRRRTPLTLVALVIYVGWMVETIGFTPAVYTGFQWYTWGFIGLALVGVRGLDESSISVQRPVNARPKRLRGNFVDAWTTAPNPRAKSS